MPDIINALAELGHSVKYVHNAKNKDKSPLPLFFVEVKPQDNNNDILGISSLLNTKVSIEKPHIKKRGPPQCHNCHDYRHTKKNCHHHPRCVKCGEDHHTENCTKDRSSPAKCALCSKDHTTNITRAARYSRPLSKKPIRDSLGKARSPILIKPHTNHTQKPPEIKVHIPIKLAKFYQISFLI